MAYDLHLADELRAAIAPLAAYEELKMFGGLAFMVNTHMAVGLTAEGLLVNAGGESDALLAAGATPAMMGEREMRGWLRVAPEVLERDGLNAWVAPRVAAALAQPPKAPKGPKAPRRAKAPGAGAGR